MSELARGLHRLEVVGAIVSLLVVVFVSMLITRIATIALAATGLSRESARFQARSALTGAGFTTSESEAVVRHPVRRRIVMTLMLIGSAGIAAVIGSIVLAFVQPEQVAGTWWARLLLLGAGIGALWWFANSKWVDRRITRWTMRLLDRYTSLDVRDYANLLHLGGDYVITELAIPEGHWLANRSLEELGLRREGIIVLGITRPDGTYHGVPKGDAVPHPGDVLVLYSRAGQLAELDERRRDREGRAAHREAVRARDRSETAEDARRASPDG